jgi:hypothetical protein
VILRGVPGRGSSDNPSIPCKRYLSLHFPTVAPVAYGERLCTAQGQDEDVCMVMVRFATVADGANVAGLMEAEQEGPEGVKQRDVQTVHRPVPGRESAGYRRLGKPALDLIEPRRTGRREVHMILGPVCQPLPDVRVLWVP